MSSIQIRGAVIRLHEVIKATGLSKSQIYRLEAADKFPRRLRLSEATSGWYQSEIENWLANRPRAIDQIARRA